TSESASRRGDPDSLNVKGDRMSRFRSVSLSCAHSALHPPIFRPSRTPKGATKDAKRPRFFRAISPPPRATSHHASASSPHPRTPAPNTFFFSSHQPPSAPIRRPSSKLPNEPICHPSVIPPSIFDPPSTIF